MSCTLYRCADGAIVGHLHCENPATLAANTPPGHSTITGQWRADLYRVIDGNPIEFRPDAPDADHEWHDVLKRWMLKPNVLAIREKRSAALSAMQALENSQHRALREAAFGSEDARRRLADIDSQIAELRKSL